MTRISWLVYTIISLAGQLMATMNISIWILCNYWLYNPVSLNPHSVFSCQTSFFTSSVFLWECVLCCTHLQPGLKHTHALPCTSNSMHWLQQFHEIKVFLTVLVSSIGSPLTHYNISNPCEKYSLTPIISFSNTCTLSTNWVEHQMNNIVFKWPNFSTLFLLEDVWTSVPLAIPVFIGKNPVFLSSVGICIQSEPSENTKWTSFKMFNILIKITGW